MSDTAVRWSEWRWMDFAGEHAATSDLDDLTFDSAFTRPHSVVQSEQLAQMPYDELAHPGKRFLRSWQWGWKLPQ
jgi:hypothetical protein